MTVESVSHISDLNVSYPAAGDARSEGDDHLRNLKVALKTDFPNITGPVTPTQTVLNNIGKVLLATASASASATIDFTTAIDSTYDEYELHIINAVPTNNNDVPWLRTSTDAGANFASTAGDYFWTLSTGRNATATVTNGSTTATKIELSRQTVSSTASDGGFSAVIRLFDPSGTACKKQLAWDGNTGIANTGLETINGVAYRDNTADIDALRFLFSTGTTASGKFKLYGIKK